jgi:hypothetical protein
MIQKIISKTFHVFPFPLKTTYNITKYDTKMYNPIYGQKWIVNKKFELNLLEAN